MISTNRIRLLLLTHGDYYTEGHGYHQYINLPDDLFEKRIVMNYTLGENKDKAFYVLGSIKYFFRRLNYKLFHLVSSYIKYGNPAIEKPNHTEYYYHSFDDIYISADKIIKKMGSDFKPDYILVYHTPYFVNFKVLYQLYKKTGASIIFMFADQEHMTGGCHYPILCDGYTKECSNCPACTSSKYPHDQLMRKYNLISKFPHMVAGSPWDCMLACKQSLLFKGSKYYTSVMSPYVEIGDKESSRAKFGISANKFVVLFGADSLKNVRKGFNYTIDAVEKFSKTKKDIVIIALGRDVDISCFSNIDAELITPGYLNLRGLCDAFYASDVFLNTPIADSGPVMVNYAFKLGVPVVSFDVGIANTLIENGFTGFKTDIGNLEGLIDGLNKLYCMNNSERKVVSCNCVDRLSEMSGKPWWQQFYDDVNNTL